MFLLTYRVYITPRNLLERLRTLATDNETMLNGILILLQEWTLCIWYDFSEDATLLGIVNEIMTIPDVYVNNKVVRAMLRDDIAETSTCLNNNKKCYK